MISLINPLGFLMMRRVWMILLLSVLLVSAAAFADSEGDVIYESGFGGGSLDGWYTLGQKLFVTENGTLGIRGRTES